MATPSISDKRKTFRALHDTGCFALPNPWDIGSARYLQGLGFKAIATTSSGFAWSQAHPDNRISLDMTLAHLSELVAATDIPLNADFESGFAHSVAGVAESVRLAVETGVAGLSIEDSTGDPARPLFSLDEASERMRAARQAIDRTGGDTLLVGRAECFLVGRPDLDETITRLKAYADAGADCLYAPGIRTAEQIAAVVKALHPRPVNVLNSSAGGMSMADFAALGVRRVSVGGGMARAAWAGFMQAAKGLAEGHFEGFAGAAQGQVLNGFFSEDLKRRS